MADLTPTVASILAAAGPSLGSGTSGATITQGDAIYLDTSTNTYKLADDGDAATALVAGIALNIASASQPVDFIKAGTLTFGAATTTAGAPYFLSTTAGALMDTIPASGNQSVLIAIGLGTATMQVGINNSQVAIP